MGPFLIKVGQPLRRRVWYAVRGVIDIFHLLPIVASGIVFLLLWQAGQIRELYISYLEHLNWRHIVFAFLGMGLLSAAIYASHYGLTEIRRNIIYARYVRPNIGISFRRMRRGTARILALLPWLGVALGLEGARQYRFADWMQQLVPAGSPSNLMFLGAIGAVVVAGLLTVTLLDLFRRSRRSLWAFAAIVGAIFVFAAVTPVAPWDFVELYRALGPFATLSIGILFVFSLCALIAVLSQKSQFPALTLIVIAIAVGFVIPFQLLSPFFAGACGVAVVLALLSRLPSVTFLAALLGGLAYVSGSRDAELTSALQRPPNVRVSAAQSAGPTRPDQLALVRRSVQERFQTWLENRRDTVGSPTAANKAPYPVFIIAVEGGGIYAATAAALFLAKMQDSQPCFAEHVFAISGVSGGAIGATIFQALTSQRPDCTETARSSGTSLTPEIRRIMKDDYFSPVVGAILTDFLGEKTGRVEALEKSFVASVKEAAECGTGCGTSAADKLTAGYLDHWSPTDVSSVALVLNTTTAETGYRVAFAPFYLNAITDQTLYSFDEFIQQGTKPGTQKATCDTAECNKNPPHHPAAVEKPENPTSADDVSLIFAAVASARFPLILPPLTVFESGARLNFVDGGYVDNSGATTALDIYRSIQAPSSAGEGPNSRNAANASAAQNDKKAEYTRLMAGVDIRIILLTGANSQLPDMDRGLSTMALSEVAAPLDAIVSVRDGLASQAVRRTCDYFRLQDDVDDACNSQREEKWRLKLIRIDDKKYHLPLGWKISDSTLKLIESLVGAPDHNLDQCVAGKLTPATPDANSCVLSAIKHTLDEFEKQRSSTLREAGAPP